MALQIRRGNTSERVAATPADGEISWDKTLKQLFVGEVGSPNIWTNVLSTAAGTGLQWNSGTSKLDVTGASFNSDIIVEGSTNRFFTNERAQDAVSTMFTTTQYILTTTPSKSGSGPYFVTYYFSATTAPSTSYQYTVAGAATSGFNGTKNATASSTTSITLSYASDPGSWTSGGTVTITSVLHTGITFTYDDVNDKLLATVISSTSLTADPNPTLGGNLTLNSYSITGTGGISITGAISGTTISAGTGLGANLSLNGNNITGTGNINTVGTFYASTGLGGNLSLNGNNITGTGNINTTGTFYASSGLGGNLGLNNYNITGAGNINTTGNITNTGNHVLTGNLTGTGDINRTGNAIFSGTISATAGLGNNLNLNNYNITGTGNINTTGTFYTSSGLGGNLGLNNYSITGSGSINITGNISATGLGADLSLNGNNITGTGNVSATSVTASTITTDNILTSGNGPVAIKSINAEPAQVVGITNGTGNIPFVTLRAAKGTLAAPNNLIAGDLIGGYQIKGYGNGDYLTAMAIIARWATPTVDFTKTYPASQMLLVAGGNSNAPITATFDGITGVFNAPSLATPTYSVAGTPLPNATNVGAGARAFVIDATSNTYASTYTGGGSNKVPVYSDGTNWKIG
jgi:hypothetical protein